MPAYNMITATDLKKVQDGVILDVRTPAEHEAQSLVRPHDLVPLDQLNPRDFMLKRGLDKDANVYLLCRGGTRAKTAADKFVAAGYPNVHVIEGGIIACEGCGEPTAVAATNDAATSAGAVRVMPLERQVRIAAGGIIVLGSLFGFLSHSIFHLIPLSMGAGLIYAGVTDRCRLAMVLGKMPWNKGGAACATSCATSAKTADSKQDNAKAGGCS